MKTNKHLSHFSFLFLKNSTQFLVEKRLSHPFALKASSAFFGVGEFVLDKSIQMINSPSPNNRPNLQDMEKNPQMQEMKKDPFKTDSFFKNSKNDNKNDK